MIKGSTGALGTLFYLARGFSIANEKYKIEKEKIIT